MKYFIFILLIIVFLPLDIFARGAFPLFSQNLFIPPILESEGVTEGIINYLYKVLRFHFLEEKQLLHLVLMVTILDSLSVLREERK